MEIPCSDGKTRTVKASDVYFVGREWLSKEQYIVERVNGICTVTTTPASLVDICRMIVAEVDGLSTEDVKTGDVLEDNRYRYHVTEVLGGLVCYYRTELDEAKAELSSFLDNQNGTMRLTSRI